MSEPTTEAGWALLDERDWHKPSCPRWFAISDEEARCDCGLLVVILAIEREAVEKATARLDDADFAPILERYGDKRAAAALERVRAVVEGLIQEAGGRCVVDADGLCDTHHEIAFGRDGCEDDPAEYRAVLAILDAERGRE